MSSEKAKRIYSEVFSLKSKGNPEYVIMQTLREKGYSIGEIQTAIESVTRDIANETELDKARFYLKTSLTILILGIVLVVLQTPPTNSAFGNIPILMIVIGGIQALRHWTTLNNS